MLSYRHAFHAGNHADVLKHLVLVCALDHLLQKADKPFLYAETHAGAGGCDLEDAMAAKNAEFRQGIARLWDAGDLPSPLAHYVGIVRGFNPGGRLAHYPGSPAIARHMMPTGRLDLCELHPDDHRRLTQWAADDRGIRVHREDGFQRLRALLPPVERRALVLIDPPYEVKDDYRRVATALGDSLTRFPNGVYLAWYPLLNQPGARTLPGTLEKLSERWLRVELGAKKPAVRGMFGSGIFVLNPPWRLQAQLESCRAALERLLCEPGAGGLSLKAGPGTA